MDAAQPGSRRCDHTISAHIIIVITQYPLTKPAPEHQGAKFPQSLIPQGFARFCVLGPRSPSLCMRNMHSQKHYALIMLFADKDAQRRDCFQASGASGSSRAAHSAASKKRGAARMRAMASAMRRRDSACSAAASSGSNPRSANTFPPAGVMCAHRIMSIAHMVAGGGAQQNPHPMGACRKRHRAFVQAPSRKKPRLGPSGFNPWPFRCARAAKTTRRRLRSAVPAATPGGRPSGKPQGLPSLRLSVVSARGALGGPSGLLFPPESVPWLYVNRCVCCRLPQGRTVFRLPHAVSARPAGKQRQPVARFGAVPPKNSPQKPPCSRRPQPPRSLQSPVRIRGNARGGEAETQPPAGRPRACTSKGPLERDAGSHALRAVPGTK